jgi:hypothetical protein
MGFIAFCLIFITILLVLWDLVRNVKQSSTLLAVYYRTAF